jgi:uncharacterized membrane protein YoaK (UPF0700 family)
MQSGASDAKIGIVILSLAMGMMNNTLSPVGAEAVSLTFVTGDLNRIGSHLALAVKRRPCKTRRDHGLPILTAPAFWRACGPAS